MKTPEETIDWANIMIDNIFLRPRSFGTNQESLYSQFCVLLRMICFIKEKKVAWHQVNLDTCVTLGINESSVVFSNRGLSDENFMKGLKIMRNIVEDIINDQEN